MTNDHPDGPALQWNAARLSEPLARVRFRQGRAIGCLQTLDRPLRVQATRQTLIEAVLESGQIAGQSLDEDQVRYSISRRFELDSDSKPLIDPAVERAVEIMFDATQRYAEPLDVQRLSAWHALGPASAGLPALTYDAWRPDASPPTPVAPDPRGHLAAFIHWFEATTVTIDPVIRAGVAHFWFLAISPFTEGNHQIACALTNLALARSEQTPHRVYSLSAQSQREGNAGRDVFETTHTGSLDITAWLEGFLDRVDHALDGAETMLASLLQTARLFQAHAGTALNERQRALIRHLLQGNPAPLTTSKWAALTQCSQDTALRDIGDLVRQGILVRDTAGGRSTRYTLRKSG